MSRDGPPNAQGVSEKPRTATGGPWAADKNWRRPLVRLIDVSTRLEDPGVARDAFQMLTGLGPGEKQNQ
jgi:hypothetical protein